MNNQPQRTRSMALSQRILLTFMIAGAILIAAYAVLFQLQLTGDPDFQARFAQIPLFAAFHVVGSGLALLIGGFQFLPRFRARHLKVHRWLGRIYLLAVLIGGIGSLALARQAHGGLVSELGFGMLGTLWLISGWQAYAAIRRRDILNHRRWMIRCYALTFAAVTLRIHLGVTGAMGIENDTAYPAIAWFCWVPNLIIAEWLILSRPWQPGQLETQKEAQMEERALQAG